MSPLPSHEQSTKYLNFSASEEKGSSLAQHRYQASKSMVSPERWRLEHGLGPSPGAQDGGGMWGLAWSSPSLSSVQVNNLGQRDLPVSISFLVPVELNQVTVWTGLKILHPQVLKDCSWLLP